MATYDLTLVEGLNAVSIPLEMSEEEAKWSNILEGIAFNSVRTIVDGEWKDYIRGRPSDLNDFDSADFKFGYLLDVIRLGVSPALSLVTPVTTNVSNLVVGDPAYVDRDVTVASIPQRNDGAVWMTLAADDSTNSSGSYLTFTTDRTTNVYLAYDQTATAIPSWLEEWEFTDTEVNLSDGSVFDVYRIPVPAGNFAIPGNQNDGGTGTNMYLCYTEENTFPLDVVSPMTNKIVFLNEGKEVYVDEDTIVTDLPEVVENLDDWIIFNNSEVDNTDAVYAAFELPTDSNVYVAFDTTGCPVPSWLSDWDELPDILYTTTSSYKLFVKSFSAGLVELGGASAGGTVPENNYFVGMKRLHPLSVTVTLTGVEPAGINEIQITGKNKSGLSFIGFPKSNTADQSIAANLDARGLEYEHIARIDSGIWENYVPGRDDQLNWYPPDLDRGKGYVVTSAIDEDQILEIDYGN